jgi:aryl-alcohol dehydrogenase-like predicted oxidoreductase
VNGNRTNRREFLQTTAAAAAVGAVAALPPIARAGEDHAEEIKKTRSHNADMEYRRLGKSGLWVSAVCLGGHWKRIDKIIGKGRDSSAFDANRHDVVSRCLERGINYIDACMGQEIMAYAKAIKGRREKVFLGWSWAEKESRQAAWRTTEKLLQGLDEGLKESGLDHADFWRVTMHERGGNHTEAETEAMVAALEKAKKAGKVRFGGFLSHDRKWIISVIEKYPTQIDAICTPYTADSKELPTDSLFDTLRKHDVGMFGIKPFASNSLFKGDGSPGSPNAEEDDNRARLALRYILANPAVTAPIPGLVSVHQVDNAAKAVQERRRLGAAEKAELKAAVAEMWANLPEGYEWLREWRHV